MILRVYTDGGALNNPGPAASAFAIYLDQKLIDTHAEPIGIQTNNIAEYTALLLALEKVKILIPTLATVREIVFFSDSQLMVNQLNGFFKVKKGHLGNLVLRARSIEQQIATPVKYHHIPREQNGFTDSLVKKVLFGK